MARVPGAWRVEGGVTGPIFVIALPTVQGWVKVTKGKMRFRGERVRDH